MAVRIGVALAALVAALVIAACGSDDSSDDSGTTSSATAGVPTVDASGKPSGELTISNWPLYIDKQTIPDFEEADRGHGQVHRGRQRQRRVLRQGPAAARPGRVRRALDLRRHRLDGEQDARARLPAELRQVGDAEQRREHRAEPRPPALRPQPRLLDAVADGDDRAGGAQGPGARRDLDLRPVRPPVRGQGRDAHRDARHRAAGDEVHGRRPQAGDRAGLARRDREDLRRGRLGPDPPLHRQRLRARRDQRRRRRR